MYQQLHTSQQEAVCDGNLPFAEPFFSKKETPNSFPAVGGFGCRQNQKGYLPCSTSLSRITFPGVLNAATG